MGEEQRSEFRGRTALRKPYFSLWGVFRGRKIILKIGGGGYDVQHYLEQKEFPISFLHVKQGCVIARNKKH